MTVTRDSKDASLSSPSMAMDMPMSSQRQPRKAKDRGAKFNEKHALKYGLSICSRSAKDNSVEMVMCKFCVAFGKESASDSARKRRATANIKYFRQPFRADHYLSHLEINHKLKWAVYEHATTPEKENFFSSNGDDQSVAVDPLLAVAAATGAMEKAENDSLNEADSRPQLRVGPVRLPVSEIEKDVVEILVGELFFNASEEQGVTREQALDVFVRKEGTSNYEICIKNKRLYDLAVKFISSGASYRLASRLVQCTKEETKLAYYGGCYDARVAGYVRAILASNLQRIAWMMRAAWTYAIATETVHHQATAYLDVRVRVWHNGGLRDFHLVTIPAFDRVPVPVIVDRLEKILSILDPRWRLKVLGTTANGGMSTGRHQSITSNQQGLAAQLTALAMKPNFYLIWSAAYQLQVVVKNCMVSFCDKAFYEDLVNVVSVLRTQSYRPSGLLTQFTAIDLPDLSAVHTAPRGFVQMLMKALQWLLNERVAVTQFFHEHGAQVGIAQLSPSWWIGVTVALRVVAEVDFFMKRLLTMDMGANYISDQVQELVKLVHILKDIVGASQRDPCDASHRVIEDAVVDDSFVVTFHSTQQFIQSEGGPVAIEMFNTLRGMERVQLTKCVALLAVDLLSSLTAVVHEGRRYSGENAGVVVTPPRVMPYEVYQMGKDDYVKMLLSQEDRLRETFTAQEIRRIQSEYYYFVAAIESEPILSGILKKHGADTDVSFAWSCVNGRVLMLQEFVGGLATVVPDATTGSLQGQLSQINWEKPDYRLTTVDFALEGILHAQQKLSIEVVDVNHERAVVPMTGADAGGDVKQMPTVMAIDMATPAGGLMGGHVAEEDRSEQGQDGGRGGNGPRGDGYTIV